MSLECMHVFRVYAVSLEGELLSLESLGGMHVFFIMYVFAFQAQVKLSS